MVELQRNANWDEVGVILVNDGEESRLPDELFEEYSFPVKNMTIPHGGVSRARNAGIDASDAEYVMICDFDDCFMTVNAVQTIFAAMDEWPDTDVFISPFMEEIFTPDGTPKLVRHDDDGVFIHGKIFRREWMIEEDIRFCDGITLHEDVYFVNLARSVVERDRIKEIPTPFWLWCWNENSTGRAYGDNFILYTYDHLMRKSTALVKEYERRGMHENAVAVVCKTMVDAYYDLQNAEWKKQADWYRRAEEWTCGFFKRYGLVYAEGGVEMIAYIANKVRMDHYKTGELLMETRTMGEWLQHLMTDVRPVEDGMLDV